MYSDSELSITICSAIIVTASSTPESYEGAHDGTITLEVVEGGSAPYSYFWTGPNDFTTTQYVTTFDNTTLDYLTGLAAGTYTVTVLMLMAARNNCYHSFHNRMSNHYDHSYGDQCHLLWGKQWIDQFNDRGRKRTLRD